jgi:hypothetical protein
VVGNSGKLISGIAVVGFKGFPDACVECGTRKTLFWGMFAQNSFHMHS